MDYLLKSSNSTLSYHIWNNLLFFFLEFLKKRPSLRDFSYILYSTFVYEPILVIIVKNQLFLNIFCLNLISSKLFMKANIMKTYIFEKMRMTSEANHGHIRPLLC